MAATHADEAMAIAPPAAVISSRRLGLNWWRYRPLDSSSGSSLMHLPHTYTSPDSVRAAQCSMPADTCMTAWPPKKLRGNILAASSPLTCANPMPICPTLLRPQEKQSPSVVASTPCWTPNATLATSRPCVWRTFVCR